MSKVVLGGLTSVLVEEVSVDDGAIRIAARTMTSRAWCPACGARSERRHGRYRRRLADLAVAGRRSVIELLVNRFVCASKERPRRTFVEQVEGLTEPFARRTVALRQLLEKVVLAVAGRPGARLSRHLGIAASPNSLLRLVRKHSSASARGG